MPLLRQPRRRSLRDLSNGYCTPCNHAAEISCLETEARLFAMAESLRYDRQLC